MKIYLNRAHPRPAKGERVKKQAGQKSPALLTRDNLRALANSIVWQGVFGRHQWSYWKFLASAATKYRRCFGTAMTLAVMGYHFQVMTRKLGKAMDKAAKAAAIADHIPAETDGSAR